MRAIPSSAYVLIIAVIGIASLTGTGTHLRPKARATALKLELTAAGARAYELLALADTFEYDTAGNGAVSDQACAVQTLLRERQSAAAFQALLEEPSLVAKLYGLAGVWHRDAAIFRRRLERLDGAYANLLVPTQSGCVRFHRTIREVLHVEGAVQTPPGTALAEVDWPKDITIDMSGGAVPLLLAHAWGCDSRAE